LPVAHVLGGNEGTALTGKSWGWKDMGLPAASELA
jgi:hypothetical protein